MELCVYRSCLTQDMSNHKNTVTVNKRKLLLYVFGIFFFAKVAGSVSGSAITHKSDTTENYTLVTTTASLEDKIAAFKKTGVGKEVNTEDYDVNGVIKFAKSLIGTPHVMGGYSSSGIDCSGLVALAHAKYDVKLPRSSHDQARYGKIISAGEKLKRGDIVFFHSTYKKNHLITHTGIYIGDNEFIHTSSKRGVTISTLRDSGYYEKHYLFATRLVH
jgi:murein DD-endopeptidase / murein LD-carboxypeptidase